MDSGSYRFDRFCLDPRDRQLKRDGAPVEMSARYLDALALLVRDAGRLVSKDRFLDEVWRGVPVTDEALTQCIRTLRKQLGDDAARPRFIETVPKHGYRFIASVERDEGHSGDAARLDPSAPSRRNRDLLLLGLAGTAGGGVAGLFGGLFYGFGAAQTLDPGMGSLSVLLVLTCITTVVALMGAAGVAFGIAVSGIAAGGISRWSIVGGAIGGLVVGAVVKLVGLDAFTLLFGQSPGDITGAAEGLLIGAAVGFGAWLGSRGAGRLTLRGSTAAAALAGGVAGMLIPLLGGKMMSGSLDLLARSFPESRLRLGRIGGLFGESGLGPVSQVVTGALEGMLFAGCVVGAMILAQKRLSEGA